MCKCEGVERGGVSGGLWRWEAVGCGGVRGGMWKYERAKVTQVKREERGESEMDAGGRK